MVEHRVARLNSVINIKAPCLCHVKCTGHIPESEWRPGGTLSTWCACLVCRVCQLPFWLDESGTLKGRRMISSLGKAPLCSADGCTDTEIIPLVRLRFRIDQSGIHHRFEHNVISISSRTYGICYGGRRDCFQRHVSSDPSILSCLSCRRTTGTETSTCLTRKKNQPGPMCVGCSLAVFCPHRTAGHTSAIKKLTLLTLRSEALQVLIGAQQKQEVP